METRLEAVEEDGTADPANTLWGARKQEGGMRNETMLRAAGSLYASLSEKEELVSPGTLIPFQVYEIIPATPDASEVKLNPKAPTLKPVQPCWFLGFITVIRSRH